MNNLDEYVADAVRYATQESGLRDWSDFIIIVHELELEGKDQIIGFPVYVSPMRGLGTYAFTMGYPWDIDNMRIKALRAILEYQETYPMENSE